MINLQAVAAIGQTDVATGGAAGVAGIGPGTGRPDVYDVAQFRAAWDRAGGAAPAAPEAAPPVARSGEGQGMRAVFDTLKSLNGRADNMADRAELFRAGGTDNLAPGDMLMMTMHAHEFLFRCQLTANVANRSSDGIQQLFRQQA